MTSIVVTVILMAIVTMLITRPGTPNVISTILHYLSASIKSLLGTNQ